MCQIVEEYVFAVFQLSQVFIYSGSAPIWTSEQVTWSRPAGPQMAERLHIFRSATEWVYFKLHFAHANENLLLRFLLDSS